MATIIEYYVVTDNEEFITQDKTDASAFYEALAEIEKNNCQFYSKEWIGKKNEWEEGEVLILN